MSLLLLNDNNVGCLELLKYQNNDVCLSRKIKKIPRTLKVICCIGFEVVTDCVSPHAIDTRLKP